MATDPSTETGQATDAASATMDVGGILSSQTESLPEHLRAPEGKSQAIHQINVLLTAILINANADLRWLNKALPDVDAAGKTTSRLIMQAQKLQGLIEKLAEPRDV